MKILTSSVFESYVQYVYQIKAQNITNWNLISDSMFCYKKIDKQWTFPFFVHEKIKIFQLWRAPAAKWCNFFQKKLHQQVLLDAKRKVKRFQLSNPHSLVMPCNQMTPGHFVPRPGPDRVKKLWKFFQLGSNSLEIVLIMNFEFFRLL